MSASQPPIFFRLDFSPAIGSGHAVRCGALAAALKDFGVRTRLVTVSESESRGDWRCEGFSGVVRINPVTNNSTLSKSDAELTLEQVRAVGAQCVVVDHYGATADYLAQLKAGGLRLAVIDDLGDRDLTTADWVLNQNLGAEKISYRTRSDCKKLLGPKFALLRKQFTSRIRNQPLDEHTVPRVLVTLGGGDTAQWTRQVLEAISKVESPLQVRCLAGGSEADLAALAATAKGLRHSVELRHPNPNVAELMAWPDVAVCAGGSTCWEFCALGVPMLVLVLVENQLRNAEGLARAGCAEFLGTLDEAIQKLPPAMEQLLKNAAKRNAMGRSGRSLVDGLGASRAAESLIAVLDGAP